MLALTHHFIVQVSAWKACVVPVGVFFTEYAILGDDIVIANKVVKNQYLKILNQLGVQCGLHKSILSPRGTALEFAKRTWHHFIDVSPVTVKELAAGILSPTALVSLMNNHSVSLTTALKVAGFGYKVLGGLNKPFHKLNVSVRNTILTTLLPSELETSAELFGRSSLTKWSWSPKSGDQQLILLLQGLLGGILDETRKFNQDLAVPNPDPQFFFCEASKEHLFIKQFKLVTALELRIKQTLHALENPLWVSWLEPLELLKEYQYCLRECATIKGMVTPEVSQAKFGVDPFTVKLWKLWSKTVAALTRFNSISKEDKENE